ncbi:sensor histidine kinase [Cryptosporangium sp. NPDC048952]|uniref:sensor histidine kinase n=1 Tax=Cryptosporangium sp. NPDC048952 TaxID=3363961 RepID=UPI00372327B0
MWERVLRPWRSLGVVSRDAVLAVGLLVVAYTPTASGLGMDLAEFSSHRPADAFATLLVIAQCVPLVLRRAAPIVCAALAFTATGIHQYLTYPRTAASLGVAIALYSLGAYQLRHRRALTAAFTIAYAVFAVLLSQRGSPERPLQYVTFYAVLAVAFAAGDWMRRQRDTAEALRKASVTAALAAERAVIARELHDVVTHHVTAMVVQADAAGFLIETKPQKAASGLATVSSTGRQALTELRHLLQVIDPTEDATREPTAGKLEDLIERTRAMGQPIEFVTDGDDVALALHRVVQEALTNAVKYAHGCPTTVRVEHSSSAVTVEVTTEGTATMAGGAASSGRGLAGLRERVSVFGGSFEAGPTDAGFRVWASLPAEARTEVTA